MSILSSTNFNAITNSQSFCNAHFKTYCSFRTFTIFNTTTFSAAYFCGKILSEERNFTRFYVSLYVTHLNYQRLIQTKSNQMQNDIKRCYNTDRYTQSFVNFSSLYKIILKDVYILLISTFIPVLRDRTSV